MLKGYLTYIVAFCAVVYGMYQVATGGQNEGMTAIWAGLGLFGVRRAIS